MNIEKLTKIKQIMPRALKKGVLLLLGLCITTLVIYIFGREFSNFALLALLWILQFFAGFLALLSFCALALNIWHFIHNKRLKTLLGLGFYFLCGIFGIFLFLFNAFVIVLTRGNL